MLRNIIWDVGGTLFDTYPAVARAFQAALKDFGKSAPLDKIEGLARISISSCAAALANEFHLSADQIRQQFSKHYDHPEMEQQRPFPGVISICEIIRATGGENVIVTHRGLESTNRLLAASNMGGFFAGCITRNDGYPRKPDPSSFEAIMRQRQMKREETMTVGDRDIDVLAGQAAGVFTCLFDPRNEGAGVDADMVIRDYRMLHQFIVTEHKAYDDLPQ